MIWWYDMICSIYWIIDCILYPLYYDMFNSTILWWFMIAITIVPYWWYTDGVVMDGYGGMAMTRYDYDMTMLPSVGDGDDGWSRFVTTHHHAPRTFFKFPRVCPNQRRQAALAIDISVSCIISNNSRVPGSRSWCQGSPRLLYNTTSLYNITLTPQRGTGGFWAWRSALVRCGVIPPKMLTHVFWKTATSSSCDWPRVQARAAGICCKSAVPSDHCPFSAFWVRIPNFQRSRRAVRWGPAENGHRCIVVRRL